MALHVSETGGGKGLQIDAQSSSNAGQPATLTEEYDTALSTSTVAGGATTFTVTKTGVGTGTVQQIINRGTGNSFEARDAQNQRFTITASGFICVLRGHSVNVVAELGSHRGAGGAPGESLYMRTNGGAGISLYVKELGGTSKTGKATPNPAAR